MAHPRCFSRWLKLAIPLTLLPLASCSGGNTAHVQAALKEWTWVSGTYITPYWGQYGTLGQPSSGNLPGSRSSSVSWTDRNGNFWLFGGNGEDSRGLGTELNDLWEFTPATQQWTWMGGSKISDAAGVYGTKGVASAANMPGARSAAVGWTDTAGNFWLFGGYGYDASGYPNLLNDLWEFNPGTKEWTWVRGSNMGGNIQGNPGPLGATSAAYVPGARACAMNWTDASGNLWLFGGGAVGCPQFPSIGNDLWKFDPRTQEWTLISGSTGIVPGNYGTKGVASPNNLPDPRQSAATWTDSNGDLWLFGGVVTTCEYGNILTQEFNDLWEFSPTSNEWTWVGGSSTGNAAGVSGAQGVAATANVPGARSGSVSWTDARGRFWLFSGGNLSLDGNSGDMNDLWMFDPGSREWTLERSGGGVNSPGNYGTKGVAATSNAPGSRSGATGWVDASGNLWLFGGAVAVGGNYEQLNDLWAFAP